MRVRLRLAGAGKKGAVIMAGAPCPEMPDEIARARPFSYFYDNLISLRWLARLRMIKIEARPRAIAAVTRL